MPEAKIGIILQARVGSTRLPGKMLRPLAGKPMIECVIDRLLFSQKADTFILAVSKSLQDDPLAQLARRRGMTCFRGNEEDVLDRFRECALAQDLDLIVRATGDNPFVDPFECDRLIDLYLASEVDYACAFPEYGSGHP